MRSLIKMIDENLTEDAEHIYIDYCPGIKKQICKSTGEIDLVHTKPKQEPANAE